jgi:hypothetical protein
VSVVESPTPALDDDQERPRLARCPLPHRPGGAKVRVTASPTPQLVRADPLDCPGRRLAVGSKPAATGGRPAPRSLLAWTMTSSGYSRSDVWAGIIGAWQARNGVADLGAVDPWQVDEVVCPSWCLDDRAGVWMTMSGRLRGHVEGVRSCRAVLPGVARALTAGRGGDRCSGRGARPCDAGVRRSDESAGAQRSYLRPRQPTHRE